MSGSFSFISCSLLFISSSIFVFSAWLVPILFVTPLVNITVLIPNDLEYSTIFINSGCKNGSPPDKDNSSIPPFAIK